MKIKECILTFTLEIEPLFCQQIFGEFNQGLEHQFERLRQQQKLVDAQLQSVQTVPIAQLKARITFYTSDVESVKDQLCASLEAGISSLAHQPVKLSLRDVELHERHV